MPPKIDAEAFSYLGSLIKEPPPPPPSDRAMPPEEAGWEPRLFPTQRKVFDCTARYVLAYGEKGSGKCTQPDAQVYTTDGLKRIGRYADHAKPDNPGFHPIEGEHVTSWDGKKTRPAWAASVWVEESTNAAKWNFSNGSELKSSWRHPLWVCESRPTGECYFGWRTAAEGVLSSR